MRLLHKTVFDVSILAWLLSFLFAMSLPVILFYLFIEPWLAILILIVILLGETLLRRATSNHAGDNHSENDWWSSIVGTAAIPIYLWAFLDRGFWSLLLVALVTVFFWISTARAYRREPIVDPSENRFYSVGQETSTTEMISSARRRSRRSR